MKYDFSTGLAVGGLTQTAATKLGEHGITVNAYAPGIVDTDFLGLLKAATSSGQ